MIETECQQLIVSAVKYSGGNALKLNNRFLVGVVDLLVKLPTGNKPRPGFLDGYESRPAFWLEAKLVHLAPKTLETNHNWKLDVTKKQKQYLRDWEAAGMEAGVVSFIQVKGQNVNSLRMALYWLEDCVVNDWRACVTDHYPLGKSDVRAANIMEILETGMLK